MRKMCARPLELRPIARPRLLSDRPLTSVTSIASSWSGCVLKDLLAVRCPNSRGKARARACLNVAATCDPPLTLPSCMHHACRVGGPIAACASASGRTAAQPKGFSEFTYQMLIDGHPIEQNWSVPAHVPRLCLVASQLLRRKPFSLVHALGHVCSPEQVGLEQSSPTSAHTCSTCASLLGIGLTLINRESRIDVPLRVLQALSRLPPSPAQSLPGQDRSCRASVAPDVAWHALHGCPRCGKRTGRAGRRIIFPSSAIPRWSPAAWASWLACA